MLARLISFTAAFFMLFQCAFPPEAEPQTSGELLRETAPVSSQTRTADKIDGVDGSEFYIERPDGALNTVYASDFGMSPQAEDNFPALKNALAYCKENPGTRLVIESGEYYLVNNTPLSLNGFKDTLIEGEGARLIFSEVVLGFEIRACDCIEIKNIEFDWDWEKAPLSDIVVIRNASPKTNTLDFVFPECEEVDEDMIFAAITQCDPDTLTYGAKRVFKENYIYQHPEMIKSVTKTEKNVLRIEHDGGFKDFSDGDTFILRHYVYDTSFAVINGESRNVTINGISVYGYPGSGFVVSDRASHFQIINTYIGVEPSRKSERHTSLGSDAIHIVNTNGCFNIENCDISGQGDDALNVHDSLGVVTAADGNSMTLVASAMNIAKGDVLKFKDEKFNETDITAEISEVTYYAAETYYDITFTEDMGGKIGEGYIAYNTNCDSGNYVIRNNYFHENRARGLLLQSSFGLCENNRFYKTHMQAIKIIMDVYPGLWYEGTGVDRLVIRNNEFEYCDYISTGEVITVGSNLAGEKATSQPFVNIEITDNTFTEFPASVLNADNVNGLVFSGNSIDCGTDMPSKLSGGRAVIGKYTANIVIEKNEWKNCLLGEAVKAKTLSQWARLNSKIN